MDECWMSSQVTKSTKKYHTKKKLQYLVKKVTKNEKG
jgi:hypothetical protein